MKHPGEQDLALYAGGELPLRRRCELFWHLRACQPCRSEVESFRSLRSELREGANALPPGLNWSRLAEEMKANIRVGLAAGECVGPAEAPQRISPWRVAALAAPLVLLLLAGIWLEHARVKAPAGPPAWVEGTVLETASGGIELRQGDRILSLRHPDAGNVTYTGSAQGSLRARYVDAETGQVTIQNVYAE